MKLVVEIVMRKDDKAMSSKERSSLVAHIDAVRKMFPQKGNVYDVVAAHRALEALAAVAEAASYLNQRAKDDLPEWYAEEGDGTDPDFTYFIDLDTALTALGTIKAEAE